MKNRKIFATLSASAVTALIILLCLFGLCVPLNIHSQWLWIIVIVSVFAFIFTRRTFLGFKDFGKVTLIKKTGSKGRTKKYTKMKFSLKPYILPLIILGIFFVAKAVGSTFFNATTYASILTVTETEFSEDMDESVGTDSIALMDTASAKMLGDREIGSLSNVVSQFNVSDWYSQIDYQGKPIKVSALEYAGFFKWLNNKESGIHGYVTVDPVSMSASFNESKGMKYVPSAYFFEDANRRMWLEYPTLIFDYPHFEIDESGKPYYIASVYEKTIALFGGRTVSGCLILDPVTGDVEYYSVGDIPRWVDIVFDGYLLCEQYNWFGTLQNGFWNSIIGKKGCKQITVYYSEEQGDSAPSSDFGYVAKDGDIWIYTGITSVNSDSSNIGFILANERTGECHYYSVAGADEKSAMTAAEGEVQEKGYQASFPSLINVDGKPTYIMVLKDSGGLVKLYAAVNVEQYNLVTTAATQSECLTKYRKLLGLDEIPELQEETKSVTVTVASVKYIVIDGNTYVYLIDTQDNIYKAKAANHENMLLIESGDRVKLSCADSVILRCEKLENS
ncbi:MAG: hypothetical protein ACI4GC_03605 [Acutalibacteraceae bacterium]